MLRKIRKTDLKKVLWLLVIVIVPAFVFWGSRMGKRDEAGYAGIIYGRKIDPEEYYTALRNIQILFLLSFGRQSLENMKPQDLLDYAWRNLLLLEKAEKENIKASDKEVVEKIKSFAWLKGQGKLTKERYLSFLKSRGVLPGQFEEFLKGQIKIEKLTEKVIEEVNVTEEEIRERFKTENEEAKIKYVFIDLQNLKKGIDAKQEQLQDFFEGNKERFRIPPKAKIAYILINDSNPELIKNITELIDKKTDLRDISKQLGLEITESGYFSINEPIEGLGWENELAEQAHVAEPGQIKGPYQVTEGEVFFKKIDRKDSYIPNLSEITDKVRQDYIDGQAYKKAKELAEEITSKAKEEKIKDLKDLNKYFSGLTLIETGFFKRKDYIENIGLARGFNSKVFNLEEGQILLEPIEVKKGFCIVQLLEIKPIDEEKFKKEEQIYRARMLEAKKSMAFNTYLSNLIKESEITITQQ